MKLFLLILTVLARIVCAGQSQTTDTLCLPVSQLKAILIDAKQKPILLSKIDLLTQDVANYQYAFNSLNIALKSAIQKDSSIQVNYTREIQILNSQKADYVARVTVLEKQLKKSNRKTRLAGLSGLLLSGGIAFLLLK